MEKVFNGRKISIKQFSQNDLKKIKKFQDFINSFIEEEAKITMNKKLSLREEREWMKDVLKKLKSRKGIYLFAECDNKVVGTTFIRLGEGRNGHVADFGITIRNGYRRIGLGKYLMAENLKSAKKELKPPPKIIRLSVFPNNKPAIHLYKKFGFKRVARIPKQIEFQGKLIDEVVMIRDFSKEK